MSIRLATLLAELPVPDPPPGTVRERADQILSGSQFHTGSSKSLMQRFLDWLGDQITLPFTSASGGNDVVGFVILVAFLALLVYVLSRLRVSLPTSVSEIDVVDVGVEADEERPADAWRRAAEDAEAAGEWKIALRARYRWLLGELFERQLLTNVPGRTPGEYRNDVARVLAGSASDFAQATDLFEHAWYGNESTGADENRRFRDCAQRVIAATEKVPV
jgi:hypothetical protein